MCDSPLSHPVTLSQTTHTIRGSTSRVRDTVTRRDKPLSQIKTYPYQVIYALCDTVTGRYKERTIWHN